MDPARSSSRLASSSLRFDLPKRSLPVCQASPSSSTSSGEDCASSSSSDSDDEAGIFFGAHDPQESEYVAQLSVSSPFTSTGIPNGCGTSRGVRVKKRDSREFLRRKTLLLPSAANAGADKSSRGKEREKGWPGGFYERRDHQADDSDAWSSSSPSPSARLFADLPSPLSKPQSHLEASDLTLNFAAFRLTDASSVPTSSSTSSTPPSVDDDIFEGTEVDDTSENATTDGGESDKENVELHYSPRLEVEDERATNLTITVGFDRPCGETEDEPVGELDMGGLRLSDLSDPELTYDQTGASADDGLDFVESSSNEGELENDIFATSCLPDHVEEDDIELLVKVSPRPQDQYTVSPNVIPVANQPVDSPDVSSTSELDSPLPVARAGPVVIPPLSHHLARSIRAETGSPFRTLPGSPSLRPNALVTVDIAEVQNVRLGELSSPSSSTRLAQPARIARTPRLLGPLLTSPSPCTCPLAAPPSLSLTAQGGKVLKPIVGSAVVPASVDRPRVVTSEEKVAAQNIRTQLDAATMPSKLSAFGPPQRTVSSSSVGSSSNGSNAMRPGKLGMGAPSRGGKPALRADTSLSSSSSSPQKWSGRLLAASAAPAPAGRPLGRPTAGFELPTGSRPAAVMGSSYSAPSRVQPVSGPSSAAQPKPKPAVLRPTPASRPVFAARTLPQPAPRNLTACTSKIARSVAQTTIIKSSVSRSTPIEVPTSKTNPLKRPLPTVQPAMARSLVSTTSGPAQRPTFCLPYRMVPSTSHGLGAGGFSLGVGGETIVRGGMGAPSRSPARPGLVSRRPMDGRGTPLGSRFLNLGTPSRFGTPKQSQSRPVIKPFNLQQQFLSASNAASNPAPSQDVYAVEPSATSGAPATATRHATELAQVVQLEEHRGSSEDAEDVSFALPRAASSEKGSSPVDNDAQRSKDAEVRSSQRNEAGDDKTERGSPLKGKRRSSPNGRPKRATRPQRPQQVAAQTRVRPQPNQSIVPGISEKELKAITDLNTAKNEVRQFAMDRQVVKRPGPRPPSPDSKMRTSIDRDEDERRNTRDHRAKRRAGEEQEISGKPVIETVVWVKGPGEVEDYVTPARPAKKAKLAQVQEQHAEERFVKWNRKLMIIRDDGERMTPSSGGEGSVRKSCMKPSQAQMDQHGNLVDGSRPPLKIKLPKITVTAIFYDGEDPTPPVQPSSGTRSKKK